MRLITLILPWPLVALLLKGFGILPFLPDIIYIHPSQLKGLTKLIV